MAGRPVHTFEVVRTEQLTPHLTRVVLGGGGFDTFTPNDFTDAYVKIVFVPDGIDVAALPQPLTLDSFKTLPVEHQPPVRTYTVRRVDAERREITIDFVVHGDHGVAGPWAVAATPGQPAYLMGPSGAYAPDPGGGLAPARRRRGGRSGDQRGAGSVAGQRNRPGLHRGRGPRRRDRTDRAAGRRRPLDLPRRPRRPGVRGHGRRPRAADRGREGRAVAAGTGAGVHPRRGADRHAQSAALHPQGARCGCQMGSSISGYWRRGRTEETFRQWKAELAKAEQANA